MTSKLLILLVTFYAMQICITDAEYEWINGTWNWQGEVNDTSVEESDYGESDLEFMGSGDGLFGDSEGGDDGDDYKYSEEYYEDTKVPKELFEKKSSDSS